MQPELEQPKALTPQEPFDVTIREGPLGIGVSAVKDSRISRIYGMQFDYYTGKGNIEQLPEAEKLKPEMLVTHYNGRDLKGMDYTTVRAMLGEPGRPVTLTFADPKEVVTKVMADNRKRELEQAHEALWAAGRAMEA